MVKKPFFYTDAGTYLNMLWGKNFRILHIHKEYEKFFFHSTSIITSFGGNKFLYIQRENGPVKIYSEFARHPSSLLVG